jgi:hypothetical protein
MAADPLPLRAACLGTAAVAAVEAAARHAAAAGLLAPLAATGVARVLDLVLLAAAAAACGVPRQHFGLGPQALRRGLARGALWAAAFGLAAAVGAALMSAVGIDPLRLIRPARPLAPAELPGLLLVGGLLGPLAEEFFFRGFLYGALRRLGVPAAVLLSTALFTALHPAAAGLPVPQIVGGLVFAAAYEIEKSLIVPAVVHVAGNLALFTLPLWFA